MKDTASKESFTSHPQLNKYLLAGLQLDDQVDSYNSLCEYITELYESKQIALDDVQHLYYEHFLIDTTEHLSHNTLVSCGVFGFEIERILESSNQFAKLKLIDHEYALEELAHDYSDNFVRERAKLILYQKEQESLLPKHFKIIYSQLNNKQFGGQLTDDNSLLITLVSDMLDVYSRSCDARVCYNGTTDTYTYSITMYDTSEYDFTHIDATRLLKFESRFAFDCNSLKIYSKNNVDAQRVIDVLKFFFEEYL